MLHHIVHRSSELQPVVINNKKKFCILVESFTWTNLNVAVSWNASLNLQIVWLHYRILQFYKFLALVWLYALKQVHKYTFKNSGLVDKTSENRKQEGVQSGKNTFFSWNQCREVNIKSQARMIKPNQDQSRFMQL